MSITRTYTAEDGTVIAYRLFEASRPRAVVVALHGVRSHGEWYLDSARYLCECGFTTMLVDRRGSGLNECARGDTPNARTLLNDVDLAVEAARGDTALLPLILMGISWGGKLAACYAAKHPEKPAGLILSAPGIAPRVRLTVGETLRVALCGLISPRTEFEIPIPRDDMFTANPARLEYLANDTLSLFKVTARFFVASRTLDGYLARRVSRISAPTLMLLAGHDRIVDNEGLRAFYAKLKCPKEIVVFGDAHHTLEFEPDPKPYFDRLAAWIDGIVSG